MHIAYLLEALINVGIESLDIDLKQNKVTVRGYVDRMMVLRAIRRAGKRVEFWNPHRRDDYHRHLPDPYGHGYPSNTDAFARSYNYEHHGYNVPYQHYDSQYFGFPNDAIATLFSDDNPHGCSIM